MNCFLFVAAHVTRLLVLSVMNSSSRYFTGTVDFSFDFVFDGDKDI